MSNYVVVTGTISKNKLGSLHHAKSDVIYNMRLARRKNDKATYVRMLKLKGQINYAIRTEQAYGIIPISLCVESWKSGDKYVVRGINGKFRAVIPK